MFVTILRRDKVREIGLHKGKIINVVCFLSPSSLVHMEPARSDLVDQRRPYKREEGCGAGRIREEAAAICLYIQYTMCEEPVGRYESHKLSC